jgi:beta-xylosidase
MKKLILSSFIFLAILISSTGQNKNVRTSGNPVFPGWYADPEIVIFNKTFWIYPTWSAKYKEQVFLDAFSSPDLVKWTKHSHVLDTSAVKWAWMAMWAPAVFEKDGRYFLLFGANDIQNDNEKGGIGIAVSDKPEGPFKDYLGKPLVDKFYNGAQPIDQFVFKDKDGQYYLIYGGWKHCNIARLNKDFTGFLPFPDGTTFKEITPDKYVEGPCMYIRNGKYYFMWSEGGWTGPDYSVAYAVSDNLLGPFKRIGRILEQDTTIANGAGHHSLVEVQGKDEWYIVYHRRPRGDKSANDRETCIEKIVFDNKGFINPVKITREGVKPVKM